MNEYIFSDMCVGMKATFTRTITAEMEDAFRILSGDENPLHRDDEFARCVSNGRYQKHVSFGMLTASLYSTMAGMHLPGKNSLIHSFEELSFIKPVFAGETLTVNGEVTDKVENLNLIKVKADIRNTDGKVVSRARMKIIVLQ